MDQTGFLSTTELAADLGLKTWHLRRLFLGGVLPEPGRVGGHRVVHSSEVPQIRAALVAANVLPADSQREVQAA
jgi:hypothetical protein